MTIQDLIAQNRLEEAFNALPDTQDKILLLSRYNTLCRNNNSGILTSSEYGVERSRIVVALLHLVGNNETFSNTNRSQMSSKDSLIKIMSDYRRFKTIQDSKEYAYYNTAKVLLNEIEKHESKKRVEPTYDVSGRMERGLNAQYLELMESLKETKLDNKEDFATAIKLKLGEDIPAWKDIESAYKLCVGRGMNNPRIEAAIKAKPSDIQSKVECADLIERWVANYLK